MQEIDMARRQAVMARSQKLGHCICNPAHACPCPPLLDFNVCPCAGERPPRKPGDTALTRHVRKAGCASKIGQADLLQILRNLPDITDPRVLLGTAAGDDAGVFQLDDHRALVQTVDVFTPCVDDAYMFGQIAAANSLSDIYAMGGTPLTALSIVGFPIDELDGALMEAMLRGGIEKLDEAGCALLGGHSINDAEIKCGFAVTGLIEPAAVVARDQARPGDVLVLTKPLGSGMLAFAAQLGLLAGGVLEEAGAWMAALNKDAAELMVKYHAHACTDITGFGLAGHLVAMLRGSGLDAEIELSAVPVFGTVPECIAREVYGGGVDRNQAYAMSFVKTPPDAVPGGLPVLFDPQTSGGLLIALSETDGHAFVSEMLVRGHAAVSIIGRLVERGPGQVSSELRVTSTELTHLIGSTAPLNPAAVPAAPVQDARASAAEPWAACCDHVPESETPAAKPETAPSSPGDGPLRGFRQFMKEANAPGTIDARHKKLMAIVLSIAHRCAPCLKTHLDSARAMGIPRADIDEAAALAVAFGGCTAMVFYEDACRKLGW